MTYASLDDLKKRFGAHELTSLSDRAGNDTIDDSIIERALEDADAEIELYLLRRYALPLKNPPAILTLLACDIARFRLYANHPSEEVRHRYEEAKKLLAQIAQGQYELEGKNASPKDNVQFKANPRHFGDKNLKSF